MDKINIKTQLLFNLLGIFPPKIQLYIRRIIFIFKLFKLNFNIFRKILLNENEKIEKIFKIPLLEFNIIKNNLLEIQNSEIIKYNKLRMKNFLKLIYIKNQGLKYINKNNKIKIKTFSFINLSKNFIKYNILFYQNRFQPIFLKEIENCIICNLNHLQNPEEIINVCNNLLILKSKKKLKKKLKIKKINYIKLKKLLEEEENLKTQLFLGNFNKFIIKLNQLKYFREKKKKEKIETDNEAYIDFKKKTKIYRRYRRRKIKIFIENLKSKNFILLVLKKITQYSSFFFLFLFFLFKFFFFICFPFFSWKKTKVKTKEKMKNQEGMSC